MKTFPLANANASVIAVTGTATYLLRLIDTAGSANHTFPSNLDAINITPEDGDIRIFTDNTTAAISPTASKGFLIRQGSTFMLRRTALRYIKAIAVTGTVACSVEIGAAEQEEISCMAGGSGAINSVIPGTGATNLGKAEDAVHASGDTGVMALAVRQDTPATTCADGDYDSLKTESTKGLRMTMGSLQSGEVQDINAIRNEPQTNSTNISASALIYTGAGRFAGFTVNSCGAGATIKFWDSLSGAGTVVNNTMTFTAAEAQGPKVYPSPGFRRTTVGLYCTITGTMDVTIDWRQTT